MLEIGRLSAPWRLFIDCSHPVCTRTIFLHLLRYSPLASPILAADDPAAKEAIQRKEDLQKAEALRTSGQREEAIAAFTEIIKHDPKFRGGVCPAWQGIR